MAHIVYPGLELLDEIVFDPKRDDAVRLKALKMAFDRVIPPGVDISAILEHKVPGWQNVISKMFAEPQAIESAGPSLSDLTEAYTERGYTDPETCRNHACRTLAREVYSAHELSSADIRALLADLRPEGRYAEVIDAEVVPESFSEQVRRDHETTGARVSRVRSGQPVRVEQGDETPPRDQWDMGRSMENTQARPRDGYGAARTYGRYNPPTKHR